MIITSYYKNKIDSIAYVRSTESQDSLKANAFMVLKNNCNNCHATKRRITEFTLANMEIYSNAVNQ